MTEQLNIPAQVSDVFTNIAVSPKQADKYLQEEFVAAKKITPPYQRRQNISPTFATAIGLALRGIYIS